MALISPQASPSSGATTSYASIGASDTFVPTDRGVLAYRTAGTGTTLTIVIPGNLDYGVAYPDPTVVLGATAASHIGTAGLVKYADPTTGLVTITSSSQATATVAYLTV